MKRISILLCLAAFILSTGCSNTPKIAKGDRFVVLEELREKAGTQWEDNSVDGFTTNIPKGAILEAIYKTMSGSNVIECVIVEVGEAKTAADAEKVIVPSYIMSKPGYKGYAFALKMDYLGTKLKKID